MLCRLQIETPLGCCCLGRFSVAVWGYLKVVVSALLFIGFVNKFLHLVMYISALNSILLCVFASELVVDIVFQALLLVAYHKKTESQFSAYYIYTKILWVIAAVLGATYVICLITGTEEFLYAGPYDIEEVFCAYLTLIFISATVQTILWHAIKKEGTNDNDFTKQTSRIFKADFTVQIGVSVTENKVEKDDNLEEIVSEKAKLSETA